MLHVLFCRNYSYRYTFSNGFVCLVALTEEGVCLFASRRGKVTVFDKQIMFSFSPVRY
jgi:hypothetical protein